MSVQEQDILDIREAAAYLRVSQRSIARLLKEDGLPSSLLGGRRVFLRSSLREWVANRETRGRRRA